MWENLVAAAAVSGEHFYPRQATSTQSSPTAFRRLLFGSTRAAIVIRTESDEVT